MEVGGKMEIIYLSVHGHHQNDSCIQMGSDESHFNLSFFVRDKVTNKAVSTNHSLFLKRRESRSRLEPRPFCSPALRALPLGQTGSQPKGGGTGLTFTNDLINYDGGLLHPNGLC